MRAREAEIERLGKEAGRSRNLDALALQHRCEGQESLILQLTEQVLSPVLQQSPAPAASRHPMAQAPRAISNFSERNEVSCLAGRPYP